MIKNIYITDLAKALNAVEKSYMSFDTYVGLDKKESIKESTFFKSLIHKPFVDEYILLFLEHQKRLKEHSFERNFCYQLFYKWQTIIQKNTNEDYRSLKLNGEVSKTNLARALESYEGLKYSELFEKLKSNKLLEKTYFIPDLVLHGGQDVIRNQKLIVEVKYSDNLKKENHFEIDFYKLAFYQRIFQFKECVFLIIKLTKDELMILLKKVDTELVDKSGFWFMLKTENDVITYNLNELTN